jgi:threonine-phosphate decarboxylase
MRLFDPPYEDEDPSPLFWHGDRRPPGKRRWLDFSVNLNPLGPPRSVLRALRQAVGQDRKPDSVARYPDPECRALVARLAALHHVDPDQVVVGNGSYDLLHMIVESQRPDACVFVEPTYLGYLRAANRISVNFYHWLAEGDDFRLEPFNFEWASIVWLCNPNNPTGQLWPAGKLVPWIEARAPTLFVVDESFLSFRADEAVHSLIPALAYLKNVIVVRSLTKLYTLPGLRLGYAVCQPNYAEEMREIQVPWSVNSLAQVAGLAALDDTAFRERTWAWLDATRETFRQQLANVSSCLEPVPTAANFILLRLKEITGPWLTRRLAERGLLIRDASNFIGLDKRYVRVAIRQDRANRRLVEELRTILREL